ncbi:hypothetical protein K466DRAFT_270914 [Polyporus arcularius HHB13444]|uniref:Uncharacterized protein n=1 Tax=Polyporus arcularius HHB13444 TaxID=1314778 RepID=A0A5C3P134_9APHY|nr:hypothetical protein K466DRAFT_270914 [Polyporus arcularius HHB13444]
MGTDDHHCAGDVRRLYASQLAVSLIKLDLKSCTKLHKLKFEFDVGAAPTLTSMPWNATSLIESGHG